MRLGFIPERDYVTFMSSQWQIRLSSVTFVRPTLMGLKLSAIFLRHLAANQRCF